MLTKNSLLAAKLETTNGTAIAVAAADADFIVQDLRMFAEMEHISRMYNGSASKAPGVVAQRLGRCTFRTEIKGLGAVSGSPEWANTLLPGAGLYDDSNTWKLKTAMPGTSSTVPRTLTLARYIDGKRMVLAGAVCESMEIHLPQGRPGYIDWNWVGKYSEHGDASILAPTQPTTVPPRAANMTFTVNGVTPKQGELVLYVRNTVHMIEDISTGGGTAGYAYGAIVDREVGGSFNQLAVLIATRDDFTTFLNGTQVALVANIGGATWNEVDFSMPKIQFTDVQPNDNEGLEYEEISFQAQRSAADDDEFTIAFVAGS